MRDAIMDFILSQINSMVKIKSGDFLCGINSAIFFVG